MAERINLCDVAKEHLLPWLAGRLDGTPEGQAFEAHVRECKACSALVTDRRTAMQALLALADEATNAKQAATQDATPPQQLQLPSWRALVQSKGTVMLTVAAAALLAGSYLMKPSDGLLGDKAVPSPSRHQADGKEEVANTESAQTTHAATVASEAPTQAPPNEEAQAERAQPRESEPIPAYKLDAARRPTRTKRVAARPAPRMEVKPKRAGSRSTGTVQVYDQNGRLIGSATTGGQQ